MTVQGWISDMKVIDVDSHIAEPADLWTSRLPKKWGDLVPHVAQHPKTGFRTWRIGELWVHEEGTTAYAGWKQWPPAAPHHLDDEGVDPGSWNPRERLKWMDANGIHAQVLYPNILAFHARVFMQIDREVALGIVQAWNDFQSDFAAEAPGRFIPVAMLPFWDVQACVREMRRCYDKGHRGVLFGNKYDRAGLPTLEKPHWDPIYAAAQEMDMPMNFHVGVGELDINNFKEVAANPMPYPVTYGQFIVSEMLANADSFIKITTSGLCHRFPGIKFVSVESGFGYLPYVLQSLDWHWKTTNGPGVLPNQLLPSEYFRRQCYGAFWFETETLPLLELYPDNFMFETDYPHPTGMCPGPATVAIAPNEHIEKNMKGVLKEETLRKVLHDNAAKLYRLD